MAMKERMRYKADTTHITLCFLISISAFILKLMLKIDRSSRSRVRTRLITKCVYYVTSERVTHLHIHVPAITRGTLARTHELKTEKPVFKSNGND